MLARRPYEPLSAAPVVTVRRPPFVTDDDQADVDPDSNPSEKI
jgi:hypothetical protein